MDNLFLKKINHKPDLQPLKRITGAGVILIEFIENKPENIILGSEYSYKSLKYIAADLGGTLEKGDDDFTTASRELREESRNLFNINKNIFKLCQNIKIGPNFKDWVYSLFILPISTDRYRKVYYKNKKLIETYHENVKTVPPPWRETQDILRFPIRNIIKLVKNNLQECEDLNGKKWEIRDRTLRILKELILKKFLNINKMIPVDLNSKIYKSKENNKKFLNGTKMYYL